MIFPRSLQYLLAIAEHGSFTRAAEVLHVSQPTLSHQIKNLEESLQSQLVDRSARTVRLTDAGEIYLRHARRALWELDAGMRAIHDVHDLSRGSLRIGWNPITDYLTCPLLDRYNSLYPGIVLSTSEMPQQHIEAALLEDVIDVGIVFRHAPTTLPESSEIETELLFEEVLCLAVGNRHAHAGQRVEIGAKEFGTEPLVMLNRSFVLRQYVDAYCAENGIAPRIAMEANSLSVVIQMVQLGHLGTVLPTTIVRTQPGLHSIAVRPALPHKAISVITRRGGYKSPACVAFTALAAEWAVRRSNPPAARAVLSDPDRKHRRADHEPDVDLRLSGAPGPDRGH